MESDYLPGRRRPAIPTTPPPVAATRYTAHKMISLPSARLSP